MNAVFKCKYYGTGYDRDMIYMDYEYRGRTYTVYENRAKGSEPLSWQHKSSQAMIDRAIELENKPVTGESADIALDKFFDYVDGNENAFE